MNPNYFGDQVGLQLSERTFVDALTGRYVYPIAPERHYPPLIFPPVLETEVVPEPSETVMPELCPDCETETDAHARWCRVGGEL